MQPGDIRRAAEAAGLQEEAPEAATWTNLSHDDNESFYLLFCLFMYCYIYSFFLFVCLFVCLFVGATAFIRSGARLCSI